MTRRNESTGSIIASVAASILSADIIQGGISIYSGKRWRVITPEQILAMAGSLVTQAEDKPTRKVGAWRLRRRGGVKRKK